MTIQREPSSADPATTVGQTAATDSVGAAPSERPVANAFSELLGLLDEIGAVIKLRWALARTEFQLLRASVVRMVLWIPVLLVLLLTIVLTLLFGLGWCVSALTGSVALGWAAVAVVQVLLLLVAALSIRRALRDSSFVHTRAHLRGAKSWLDSLGTERNP